jgi:DNA (cytosine-5)-methyltransferase 1
LTAESCQNGGIPSSRTTNSLGSIVVDLCCGAGGLSLAAKELKMQVVVGVDVNETALKTFARNFPDALAIKGSVRSDKLLQQCEQLLWCDPKGAGARVIVSGPPCQGFSAAGSRDPKDSRNKLLVAVAHAISRLQPDCALIENVSTVLAEKHSERLEEFKRALADGNFCVTEMLLDASEFGVSQKRKRAFFFITRFQIEQAEIAKALQDYKTIAVGAKEALKGLPAAPVRPDEYDDDTDYQGVPNHFAMRHSRRVINKIAAILPGTGPMSYRKLHPTRPSNTLFSGHRAPPAHFIEPRSITVREAARLQGFPDQFRIYGSFANQMEQVTNAVPPPLTRAALSVLRRLCGLM